MGRIFAWRVTERLGYQAIAERLNTDPALNPPPVSVDPTQACGQWTHSNVRDVLTNPKHTGHMVWNRHARKSGHNRINPVDEWVWSAQLTHEPLVDLETFVQAQQIAESRERSRSTTTTNRHPQTKRTYRLRSDLFCSACGRRMYGKTKHGTPYYVCAPKPGNLRPGHPTAAGFWVREDDLLDGLTQFLAHRVFGRYRTSVDDQVIPQGCDQVIPQVLAWV